MAEAVEGTANDTVGSTTNGIADGKRSRSNHAGGCEHGLPQRTERDELRVLLGTEVDLVMSGVDLLTCEGVAHSGLPWSGSSAPSVRPSVFSAGWRPTSGDQAGRGAVPQSACC